MAKIRLLQVACTVAMLATASAYAQQTETPAGTSGPGGAPNPAAQQPASGGTGSGSIDTHSMHHSATAHHAGGVRGSANLSQDAAVDQLNDQSYQAAQQGQMFNGSGPNAAMPSTGSGRMSNTSSGAVPSNTSGGSGAKP